MVGLYSSGSGKNKSGEDVSESPVAEPITAFQPVALVDGELEIADQANLNHCDRVVGFALQSATAPGQIIRVQSSGELTNLGWSFTPGDRLFLGANGAIITNVSSSGLVVPLGHAKDADTIFIDIERSIVRRNS